jgi:hypothetical protein
MPKMTKSKESGQRQTASHKTCDLWFYHVIYFGFTVGTDSTYFWTTVYILDSLLIYLFWVYRCIYTWYKGVTSMF